MPGDFVFKVLNAAHHGLMKVSGGRVGWKAAKMPVVELTTTGRKSGLPRTVLLTSPVQEGATVVLVASRWGDDHHPAWFVNLRDNAEVRVSMKGSRDQRMHARIATPDERARLWPKAVARYPRYADYQKKTEREIPLVLLEPAE